jgi:hypothetical protein
VTTAPRAVTWGAAGECHLAQGTAAAGDRRAGLNRAGSPGLPGWQPDWLLQAPHRLAFALAMLVLIGAALLVVPGAMGPPHRSAGPSLPDLAHDHPWCGDEPGVHSPVFAGFLFTAGPKWLVGRGADGASAAANACSRSVAGWWLWLAGAHLHMGHGHGRAGPGHARPAGHVPALLGPVTPEPGARPPARRRGGGGWTDRAALAGRLAAGHGGWKAGPGRHPGAQRTCGALWS